MSERQVPAETFASGASLGAHRHREAYAALVVEGVYEETSLDGCFRCVPGTLVVHPAFHCHADRFGADGGRVVNIPLPRDAADRLGYRVTDIAGHDGLLTELRSRPDRVVEAVAASGTARAPAAPPAWVGGFLADIMDGQPAARAASRAGVTTEHAGRIVRHWYGDTPIRLRREGRIRAALGALREGAGIAEAAVLAGFSDQPHLTRVLRQATGLTPRSLRAG
ncbi:helix-turn-helix domain-containing protein [Maricaulis sp.]|uniref:helix-turn-helix domain-containing protein n=1 Tax=Maricaulis sp. TaxID=1486257 RepID=UPI001B2E7968|nr:helix-turn-helix domain-containing protein [Maricaulis sp.]MBO6764090.1 AraC family transcriptional regulator [Maricaulis sp.]